MAQGTLWLAPIQRAFANNGTIVAASCKAYFYLAGTTTPVNVFSDVGLTTAITQPVTADANGIFVEVFLTPGTAYKVDIQTAAGVSLTGYPADNQLAIPASAATLDTTETAGEALTAGQVAYLSDGSGGKNAGQLYKGDAANPYSSSQPTIGMVPNAIASGATGTFRTGGQITGLSGLSIGSDYFVSGTAGAITTAAPINARYVGRADSTSSLIVGANPPPNFTSPTIRTSLITPASAGINYGVCGGRLTLTTGNPVGAEATGATTIYFSPYSQTGTGIGNIGLYDGSTNWTILPFAEISIALGTLTGSLPYDIFAYNNSGVVALRSPVAWTNGSTRATALVLQNGVWVKTGATTDRYLGTFWTDTTTQTSDSGTGSTTSGRHLWNYYNRIRKFLKRQEATASWGYSTATVRQANGSTANEVQLVVGVAEAALDLRVFGLANNGTGGLFIGIGIGEDSTTTIASVGGSAAIGVATEYVTMVGDLQKSPVAGHHIYSWNEYSAATGTTTWYGAAGAVGAGGNNGLSGSIDV